MSDHVIELPWAFDESVCQTSTVSNLYFAGMYVVANVGENDELKDSLCKMIEAGDEFITRNEGAWAKIAALGWDSGVTLGDSEIGGICEEGSLTFKEICQLPSNHYGLLDSRHGPIVVMNERTLVLAAINDVNCETEKALIRDMMGKNCTVVTVSDLPFELDGTVNFHVGEKLQYAALGLPFINTAQMITCYKAKERGVNPDQPDGLEPWITL
jgi:fructoselysine-6-P-deglycase FrlB-like protein